MIQLAGRSWEERTHWQPTTMGKMAILRGPDPYAHAEEQIAGLRGVGQVGDSALCHLLSETIPTYSWVGIYRGGATESALSGWSGSEKPPAALLHRVLEPQLRVINDLQADARAYRPFPHTRAEAMIPFDAENGPGAIVVASDHRGAFGPADLDLLRLAAQVLSERSQ